MKKKLIFSPEPARCMHALAGCIPYLRGAVAALLATTAQGKPRQAGLQGISAWPCP